MGNDNSRVHNRQNGGCAVHGITIVLDVQEGNRNNEKTEKRSMNNKEMRDAKLVGGKARRAGWIC